MVGQNASNKSRKTLPGTPKVQLHPQLPADLQNKSTVTKIPYQSLFGMAKFMIYSRAAIIRIETMAESNFLSTYFAD